MSVSPTGCVVAGRNTDTRELFADAQHAGLRAALETCPVPVVVEYGEAGRAVTAFENQGVCGGAFVTVNPGSDFYDWLAAGTDTAEDAPVRIRPIDPSPLNQSYQRYALHGVRTRPPRRVLCRTFSAALRLR